MAIYWGPELITIYNDAERDIVGRLHPDALGMPARELLKDSWDVLEPQLEAVMSCGDAIWLQDEPLRFDRRGTLEVGYFTYSCSPLPDDHGGVGGVLMVSQETTKHVLARRRIETIGTLATQSMDAPGERHACVAAAGVLEHCPDVVFTLIYLVDDAERCSCVAAVGLDGCRRLARPSIALDATEDAAAAALRSSAVSPGGGIVADPSVFVDSAVPGSMPSEAFVCALGRGSSDPDLGFVVAGVNDDSHLDDAYRRFFEMVAVGIGRSVTAARVRRLERERARSLAALAEARGRAQERAAREAELHALLDDLKAARRRVATARDAERRRIERDLHDGAQQRLMAIRLELGMLKMLLSDDEREARAELDRLHDEIGEALDELRELAHGLYPHLLVSDGLYAALTATARRAPIPVQVLGTAIPRLPREIESATYFCCLEALQNVVKHAGGSGATLRLGERDGALEFSVEDNGPGFDTRGESDGEGLRNLRDRLAALDGHVEIVSAAGRGTTVLGHIPAR